MFGHSLNWTLRRVSKINLICKEILRKNYSSKLNKPKFNKNGIEPQQYALLVIPVTTFALGVWQVQRLQWKLNLIKSMEERLRMPEIDLVESLNKIDQMEYRKVRVKGHFDYENEMYIGPRSLNKEDEKQSGGLITTSTKDRIGVFVITPFSLSDHSIRILVNRGWIPRDKLDQKTRLNGQISGEVEFTAIVRNPEKRPPFCPKHRPNLHMYSYRDVPTMAKEANTEEIFIDADAFSTIPGGPIGGQTKVNLRNEHLSYVITWFSLSALTAFLWYKRVFNRKTKL